MRILLAAALMLGAAACQPTETVEPAPEAGPLVPLWNVTGVQGQVEGEHLRLIFAAETTTPGWSDLALTVVDYEQAPANGIHEAELVGRAPGGMVAQVISPVAVEALLPMTELPPALRVQTHETCVVVLLTHPDATPAGAEGCSITRVPGLPLK